MPVREDFFREDERAVPRCFHVFYGAMGGRSKTVFACKNNLMLLRVLQKHRKCVISVVKIADVLATVAQGEGSQCRGSI